MKKLNILAVVFLLFLGVAVSSGPAARAESGTETATAGVGGYDPVAYFSQSEAVRGSGRYTAEYQGVTYLFSSEANKNAFEKDPTRYLPAFGGYCAYGVAKGKKFWADPTVWEVVNGRLYLNLDRSVQQKWDEDKPGYITQAVSNWGSIKDKSPGEL
jgi:YHS domain-containing protein